MKRGMRNGFQSAGMLAAGLLVACAVGPREVRDEGLERIEEAMRPEAHPEIIPEGIALGEDAPPLAPAEPEEPRPPVIVTSNGGLWAPGCFLGPVCGPHPGSIRYHIKATPGGSIPGLLP
jgi:hypothetical protein